MSDETPGDDEELAAQWENALNEQPDEEIPAAGKLGPESSEDDTQPPLAQMQEVVPEGLPGEPEANLDVILDIPVTISMEIGRTQIAIRNLLQLNQGSVVELDRLAGEPMDVLVNGTLIAHGEVVVINEKFGIRLTDVISASDRVKKLR